MNKNWNFVKLIDPGLHFTYDFEVCYNQSWAQIYEYS